jgi:hypothetical protein
MPVTVACYMSSAAAPQTHVPHPRVVSLVRCVRGQTYDAMLQSEPKGWILSSYVSARSTRILELGSTHLLHQPAILHALRRCSIAGEALLAAARSFILMSYGHAPAL